MSFDLDTRRKPCTHTILMERYTVDTTDFRTLRFAADPTQGLHAPINGARSVRVFVGGTAVQPDDPVYGYDIVRNPEYLATGVDAVFSNIRFRQPVRFTASLLIEVCYVTVQGFCPVCGGSGTANEMGIGVNGQPARLTGVEKMVRQGEKYVLSSSNPFDPSLTCNLVTFAGRKDAGIGEEEIASEVIRVLDLYQQVQAAQRTVQAMNPAEVLQSVPSVAVRVDPDDPTVLYVTVQMQGYGDTQPVALNTALKSSQT
jgi:hypothetical protein